MVLVKRDASDKRSPHSRHAEASWPPFIVLWNSSMGNYMIVRYIHTYKQSLFYRTTGLHLKLIVLGHSHDGHC